MRTVPAQIEQDNARQLGDARHIAIAALLVDDLAHRAAGKIRRWFFDDDHLLRDAAAFAVASVSSLGIAEVETLQRLLLRNYRPERVELELLAIERCCDFITVADLDAALLELHATGDGGES